MERFRPMPWSIERIALAPPPWSGLPPLGCSLRDSDQSGRAGTRTDRPSTNDGVTETGVVETVTIDGAVRRVIHWRTREGTVTQTVEGPMRLRTVQGDPVLVRGPASTLVHTVTTPSSTVTLPGETVQNTVTEVNTATERCKTP